MANLNKITSALYSSTAQGYSGWDDECQKLYDAVRDGTTDRRQTQALLDYCEADPTNGDYVPVIAACVQRLAVLRAGSA